VGDETKGRRQNAVTGIVSQCHGVSESTVRCESDVCVVSTQCVHRLVVLFIDVYCRLARRLVFACPSLLSCRSYWFDATPPSQKL